MTKPADRLREWGRETMTGEDSLSWKCSALLDEAERVLVFARDEYWSDHHAYMTKEQFNADPLVRDIDATLAKLRGEA